MSDIENKARGSASETVKKLNPHIFGSVAGAAKAIAGAPLGFIVTSITDRGQPVHTSLTIRPQFREGTLGKTERRWLEELRIRRPQWLGIQAMKLCLGYRTWYRPDFNTLENGKLIMWEVKGHWEPAARIKVKLAAGMYPWMDFYAVQRKKGQWITEGFHQ